MKRKEDGKKGWGQELSVPTVASWQCPSTAIHGHGIYPRAFCSTWVLCFHKLVIQTFQKSNTLFQHYLLMNDNDWTNGPSKLDPLLFRKGSQKWVERIMLTGYKGPPAASPVGDMTLEDAGPDGESIHLTQLDTLTTTVPWSQALCETSTAPPLEIWVAM